MNLIAGIVAGAVVGWIASTVLSGGSGKGVRSSLFIGIVGGLLGVQLAPMIGAVDGVDGQVNLFSLVVAAACAAGCLIIGNMIAGRRRA